MAPTYLNRSLEARVSRAAAEFPVVVLTGPRQSGKTTLLRHLFGDVVRYQSLESPDVQASVRADPRGFLDLQSPPVIFDEVQYVPELLPYIKERVDENRDRPGQYLLTGSQNLLLLEKVTESLAGRAAILRLLPLSRREATGRPSAPLPWESDVEVRDEVGVTGEALWREFLRGGYPELWASPGRDEPLWHASYLQTYLERDVRSIRQVGDLIQFQTFLRALAVRSGQLLDLSGLARDLGVAVNTIKAWLSVLEATYQAIVLRPYFANVGKRLVKTPKVYLADVGLLCHLVGLRDPRHAMDGPMGGAILETAVVVELVRTLTHRGEEPRLYFWRTSAGTEVDVVVEVEGRLLPLEVKLSGTPRPAHANSLRTFQGDFPGVAFPGYVVHPGTVRLPLGPGARSLPFTDL